VGPNTPPQTDVLTDYSWETEKAPRVSNARMMLTFGAFFLWLALLAWMAARRWYGSLL
jgi:hypothetical protein